MGKNDTIITTEVLTLRSTDEFNVQMEIGGSHDTIIWIGTPAQARAVGRGLIAHASVQEIRAGVAARAAQKAPE